MRKEPPLDAVWERVISAPPRDTGSWSTTPKRAAELRAMSYRDYLETPEWRYKRRQMIQAAERKCQRCRRYSPRLQVHHHTYDRLGNERPEDLEVLCERCHRREHGIPS